MDACTTEWALTDDHTHLIVRISGMSAVHPVLPSALAQPFRLPPAATATTKEPVISITRLFETRRCGRV